ncbi:hypothetical protein H4582DRAFT_1115883 [Lactarius indigo]|nr:hypothetical protein H4582DRAFT_1115883 [Lactarius indigo]
MSPGHQCIHLPLSSHVSNEAAIVGSPSDSQDRILPKPDDNSSQAGINFADGSDILFSMFNEKPTSRTRNSSRTRERIQMALCSLWVIVSLSSLNVIQVWPNHCTIEWFGLSYRRGILVTVLFCISAFYLTQFYQLQISLNSSFVSSEPSPPTLAAIPEFSMVYKLDDEPWVCRNPGSRMGALIHALD